MDRKYEEYKSDIERRIDNTIEDLQSQPVLFIGTGLSIRYFGAPNWEGLLRKMAETDAVESEYEFYKQSLNNKREIAEEFAKMYGNWAWEEGKTGGRNYYPDRLFDGDVSTDMYLKYAVSEHLKQITPDSTSGIDDTMMNEIESLREIQPHAVITTNYDTFLEDFVFTEYERVIGQTLIEEPYANIGEIYKIHGCVTEPSEIVLTNNDYNEFDSKKAYLSAKLLTFFTEHPILIVGYEPNDPNVKRILSDVNTVISGTDRQPNIFLIDYEEDIPEQGSFNQERLIKVGDGEQMVVNYIVASDFEWIFELFSKSGEITGVNSKLLRKLLNNTYEIIRDEAPQKEIAVGNLERIATDKDALLDIVGITPMESGGSSTSASGSPNSVAEAGVPIEQIVSNNNANNLGRILQIAVNTWQNYDVLIEKRDAIYVFYNKRAELNLSDTEIEFLFRSSISNIIQGSEWMIRYNGEMDSLLSGMTEILDGKTVAAYERNLLALGDEEKLREISETELNDSAWSNAEEYEHCCDMSPTDRIKQYTTNVVRFDGDNYQVDDLVSGSENLSDLFDEVVEDLVEEDNSAARKALRKIELIRIVNSPLCAT